MRLCCQDEKGEKEIKVLVKGKAGEDKIKNTGTVVPVSIFNISLS